MKTELSIGKPAPDFKGHTCDGHYVELTKYRGTSVVLYFYPRDFTPVCTAQACGWRDQYEGFMSMGAEILGVSSDSIDTHQRFVQKYQLPFSLLVDPDRKIRRAYGAMGGLTGLLGLTKRRTVVIDPNGTIAGIVDHPFRVDAHLHAAKEILSLLHSKA